MRNLQEQVEKAFCYQKLFRPFTVLQRISMAIQRGNAICVTTCIKDQSSDLEGLFNFQVHEAEEL